MSLVREVQSPAIDSLAMAEEAVAALLTALGRDVTRDPLVDTPRRVASSLAALLTRPPISVTTFSNAEGYRGLVLVRDIPFHSLCEHHLMPFRGVAHVGYIPRDRLVGLSTLPHIVEHFARDLQIQERLTTNIAEWIADELDPSGVGVVIEAEQMCMSLRGVGTPETRTTTSVFLGDLAGAGPLRSQFDTSRGAA